MKRGIKNMESMILTLWLLIVMTMCVKGQDSNTAMKIPPQMRKEFTETYISLLSKAEYECVARGNPAPKYEWRKLKNAVSFDQNPVVKNSTFVHVDGNSGKITFTGIQDSDYGTYRCVASNGMGTAISSVLEINKAYIQPFSNKEKLDVKPVKEYTLKKIDCKWKGPCEPTQDCKFEWKRGRGTAESILETERIAIDKNGTLYFLYVLFEDGSTNSEPIACGQTLESAKVLFKGGPIIMPVVKQVNAPQSPPIAHYSEDVTGLLSGQVTLQCIFSGYPAPSITWYRPNHQSVTASDKYSFETYGRKLIINDLQEDDEGTYTCKAFNGRTGKASVYLNVTSKPIFVAGAPESLVIPRGNNAVFTCRMRSLSMEEPPTAPKWYKNGEELPESQIGTSDTKKYQLRANKTELTVKHVTYPEDTCSFMCIAGNVIADDNGKHRFMETYAGATITVIEPIEVTVLSKTSIEINTPTPFSLVVNATTDKTIKKLIYEWTLTRPDNITFHGNTALKRAPWVVFNRMDNLTISPENVEADSDNDKVRGVTGTYQLRIYHKYQSKYVKFVVFTNLQPESVVVQSAGFDWWIIGVILGVIVLLIVGIFIVCSLIRNRDGEYLVDTNEVAAGHDQEKELIDDGYADLSRADGEYTQFDRVSSDDDSMGDYDDDTMQHFNEDGSFIGAYVDKRNGQEKHRQTNTEATSRRNNPENHRSKNGDTEITQKPGVSSGLLHG